MTHPSDQIFIRAAEGSADIEIVRLLLREYGNYLAANPTGAANICIPSYDGELAGLPGPYAPPGGVLLLALVDGQPAGCVGMRAMTAPDASSAEHAMELKRLWVRPDRRGFGLGRKLLEAAILHATERGASAIYLDTVPAAMPEANRLYTAMGFEPVARYNTNTVPGVAFFRRRHID